MNQVRHNLTELQKTSDKLANQNREMLSIIYRIYLNSSVSNVAGDFLCEQIHVYRKTYCQI